MSDSFQFDGGQVTARQLRKTVTAYSEGQLQTALENGCQNMPALMAFLARRDGARQAKVSAASRRGCRTTNALLKSYGRPI